MTQPILTGSKRKDIERLFNEFSSGYLQEKGEELMEQYSRGRDEARKNYKKIISDYDQGKDVTDDVLLKFLPYADTPHNRETNAWIHIADAVNKDVRGWFEGAG